MSWLFAFLDETSARRKYQNQKTQAKFRGIEWHLTFREWRDWWGDDLARRGTGRQDLCMQRTMDSGPYALWNISKGTPKDNGRTRSAVRQRNQPRINSVPAKEFADNLEREDGMPDLGYSSMYSVYGIG